MRLAALVALAYAGYAAFFYTVQRQLLFRLADGSLRAVGNIDPVARAAVMSRGLVGDRHGEPTVASPLLKQVFSLVDGRCLDDASVRLEQAYRASTALIDAAAPFELAELCRSAAGLCDLIGAVDPGAPFDWRIVTVHARSLRLLQTLPPEAKAERDRIVQSLSDVIERKLAQAG